MVKTYRNTTPPQRMQLLR